MQKYNLNLIVLVCINFDVDNNQFFPTLLSKIVKWFLFFMLNIYIKNISLKTRCQIVFKFRTILNIIIHWCTWARVLILVVIIVIMFWLLEVPVLYIVGKSDNTNCIKLYSFLFFTKLCETVARERDRERERVRELLRCHIFRLRYIFSDSCFFVLLSWETDSLPTPNPELAPKMAWLLTAFLWLYSLLTDCSFLGVENHCHYIFFGCLRNSFYAVHKAILLSFVYLKTQLHILFWNPQTNNMQYLLGSHLWTK